MLCKVRGTNPNLESVQYKIAMFSRHCSPFICSRFPSVTYSSFECVQKEYRRKVKISPKMKSAKIELITRRTHCAVFYTSILMDIHLMRQASGLCVKWSFYSLFFHFFFLCAKNRFRRDSVNAFLFVVRFI